MRLSAGCAAAREYATQYRPDDTRPGFLQECVLIVEGSVDVAHKYDHVDYEFVWNALVHRLPGEAGRIREILIDGAAEGLGGG
ncbi:hypothetical protein MHEI_16760 [Mycobacterium heidelbergense]|nr:hypothetical protein MHEI_16760 [Mycobacterium heidelbergense]